MQGEDRVELVRPQIPPDLLHQRSQKHQNWGTYKCLLFRKAKPTILLTYSKQLVLILIAQYVEIAKNTLDWRILPVAIATILLILMECQDPGIQSSPLPVANEQAVRGMASYCQLCRCFTSDTVTHCLKCNVCIQNSLHHSFVLGRCITTKSFRLWFGWLLLTALGILSTLCIKMVQYFG